MSMGLDLILVTVISLQLIVNWGFFCLVCFYRILFCTRFRAACFDLLSTYNATESSIILSKSLLLLLLLLLALFAEWPLFGALVGGGAFVSSVELLLALAAVLLIAFGGCQVLSAGVVASCASPPYPSSGLSASGPVNCRNLSLLYSASSSSVCSGITSCSRLLLFRMIFLPHELKIGSIFTVYPGNVDGHCGSNVDGGGGVDDGVDVIVVAVDAAAATDAYATDELLKIPTIGCMLSFL